MAHLLSNTISKYHDEIQALKAAQPLNGGALTHYSETASIEAVVDKDNPFNEIILALFEATFQRDDGEVKTPFVQFAYKLEPDEPLSASYRWSNGVVSAAGVDFVTYKVIIERGWWPFDSGQTTGAVKLTVYSYSPVEGTINIRKINP